MIDIELIKIEPFELGFSRLRKAPLENAFEEKIYEYRHANISLRNFTYDEVCPTTFYALRSHLEFQASLHKVLLSKYSINLFDLPGVLYININGKLKGLVPPFVETYIEPQRENTVCTTLQDGTHRYLLAKALSVPIRTIHISNLQAAPEYLPYSIPNSWDEVRLLNEVPQIKKRYRREDSYTYMRPLSSIFDKRLVTNWSDYGRIG